MKSDNKEKTAFVLRLNTETYEEIGKRSAEIGISRNAYINMLIHKALNEK